MLLLNGFAYVYGKKLKNGGEIWRCRMKRLGCAATMHLNEKRTEVLDGFPSSCHVGHGVDYGECNSLILKRRFKENSLSSDAMPEKVLITTVKIIKNNLPCFQLMTEDPILHLCLCIYCV